MGGQNVVKVFSREENLRSRGSTRSTSGCACAASARHVLFVHHQPVHAVCERPWCTPAWAYSARSPPLSGSLSVGMLTCFLTYANQYTKPFNEIAGVAAELQSAIASAARVFELIDAPWHGRRTRRTRSPSARADGSVEIRDVAFSYRQDVPLIENLNLAAQPGQRIAIVGPTGCGKTTIINLLMRFYDVNRGEIRVSGRRRALPPARQFARATTAWCCRIPG